jgi:2-polyprenyl-3-methyl-5-hydroxy-6-metoxy-1,4-benzoquinol methylase
MPGWGEKMNIEMADKAGYNALYKGQLSSLIKAGSPEKYIRDYEAQRLSPYYKRGNTKGYVRNLAVQSLLAAADRVSSLREKVHVLDAGCGRGELSVYLGCQGFRVTGVDISEEGVRVSKELAESIGVTDRCQFLAESLEHVSLPNEACDFVIGHAALHHFIKYAGVSEELRRILKPGGEMFFADSFGENKIYHLFHNRAKMERLGDVILTKDLIEKFFANCRVELVPTDWFVTMDKLFLRLLPSRLEPLIRSGSRLWWTLDRLMPHSRLTLYLSGAVMTHVTQSD